MKRYNPKEIEPKWQKTWTVKGTHKAVDFDKDRTKYVMLTEFPYPSGDGLHLGHVREYTLGDIIARFKRMSGYNVLYPMGYDAFGLPTENFAIKNKIAPQVATDQNVNNFQKQFESLGFSIDWSRSFRTTDPSYYKWTQWLFLHFFKEGLAYQDEIDINWCPKCRTGLANEEVVNGRHERCDTPVEKKTLEQWVLQITKYADKLIDGLGSVDYPSRIADQQINWIGRSKGAEVDFRVDGHNETIRIYTTRPDTLFGATFMVMAPEHPIIEDIATDSQKPEVLNYVKLAQARSDIERQDTSREKTGVFTGAYAINPVNNEKIPIWIADYVLHGYGTGAIMAVPAHDERDHAFAKKFDLPIKEVVAPDFGAPLLDPVDVSGPVIIGYDPKTKRYMSLIDKRNNMRWLAAGGLKDGESFRDAAFRELKEESGYAKVQEMIQLGGPTYSYFYNPNKKSNRRSFSYMFLAIISEDDAGEQELESHEKYEVIWGDLESITTDFEKEPDGRGHWIEGMSRVREAVEAYHTGVTYEGPIFSGDGVLFESGKYSGMPSALGREKIVADLAEKGVAKEKINYKLRDWIFSRQHYWGEPIPIIHCEAHGAVPVPDEQLPVELPPVERYEPTDSGESPLAAIEDWVNVLCPVCGKPARRETDTMPNWAGSSWYYLRYYDAHNDEEFAAQEKLKYWGEVDLYLGGMEHTTLHLLYSRFWHQFFYDQGLVPTPEPYRARRGQGIVLAADGSKMSKSKGNVVNPDEILEQGYGADALRLAIAFLAPYEQTTPWNPEGVAGTYRFLQRVWTLTQEHMEARDVGEVEGDVNSALQRIVHKAIKKVSGDLHDMNFNTAIAALMESVNEMYKLKLEYPLGSQAWTDALTTIVKLIAPYAPHVADELWSQLGNEGSIHVAPWPVHDDKYLATDTINIVVQVNGKVRANIEVPADATEETVLEAAKADQKVAGYIRIDIKKSIYVSKKLVNFVV